MSAPAASSFSTYTIVPITNGGMIFNLEFVNADNPTSAFESGIEQAASILSATIANQITVNLIIDYSGTGGGASAGPDNNLFEPYSTISADLQAAGCAGANSLPNGSTIEGSSSVEVWNAQAKALGLMSPNDSTTDDGSCTFNTDISSSLLVGVALHELTHAMGRVPDDGFAPDIMEFYSFTSPGNRTSLQLGQSAYFSLDGGITKLAEYGRTSDASDFLNSSAPEDPFAELYDSGTQQFLTSLDRLQLSALGFTLTPSTTPSVASINAVPSSGDHGVGKQITITVTFDVNAFVTGTPTLSLNDNGVATYQSGSGTKTLTFTYTVGSSDLNETALAVTGINLPAGTAVQGSTGNNADFSALPATFSGLQIDATPPNVTNVASLPGSGIVAAGTDVIITLGMSEPVTVTNNPVLKLNDGVTAFYVPGSSTSTSLVFDYHVGTESTTDLQITGIDQSTGTIVDLAGNPLSSTLTADLKLETNVFSWARGVGGDWNTSSNWKPVGVPVAGNTALITASGTYTITSSQATSIAVLNTQKSVTLAINAGAFDISGGTGTGTLAGTIKLADAATLGFGADGSSSNFNYTATTTLAAGADPTDLLISGNVTLTGVGKLNLSGSNDQIVSDGTRSSLTNGSATAGTTIAGVGTIGDGDLSFTNQAKGIINANSSGGLALMIATASFSNAGLLEATSHGVLVLDGDLANTTTGIVKAAASGAHVDLDGAAITGGTISTASGSSIDSTSGSSDISTSTTLANAGRLGAEGGDLIITGPVKSTGTLDANGHLLDLAGLVSGSGKATIENGGTLEFGAAATAIKQAVTFTNLGAGTETLKFDALASSSPTLIYTGTISGFSTTSDVIDFTGLTFQGTSNPLHAALSSGNTIVTVTEGADQVSFKLAGNHLGDTFVVAQDSGSGTQIVDPPALIGSAHTQMPPLGDADADSHAPKHTVTSPLFEDGDRSGSTKLSDLSLVEIDFKNDQIHFAGTAAATDHDGDPNKSLSNSDHAASVSVGDDHFAFSGGTEAGSAMQFGDDAKPHVGDLDHVSGQQAVQELHASLVQADPFHHDHSITSGSSVTQFHQIILAAHGLMH
jgi:hypothetical protein